MEKVININNDEMDNVISKFSKNTKGLSKQVDKMIEINDTIRNSYSSSDFEEFITKYNETIKMIKDEADYLDSWTNYLKKSMQKYETCVEESFSSIDGVDS
jgi:fumarate hydratase class II